MHYPIFDFTQPETTLVTAVSSTSCSNRRANADEKTNHNVASWACSKSLELVHSKAWGKLACSKLLVLGSRLELVQVHSKVLGQEPVHSRLPLASELGSKVLEQEQVHSKELVQEQGSRSEPELGSRPGEQVCSKLLVRKQEQARSK